MISRYTGNAWWGGGWYNFFYREPQRLARLSHARGYLYISLNSDKLAKGVAHHDDPVFWASKIAHEVLHNLSYWHPSYQDPKQRDEMNPPGKRAFIVAYEQSVYERAKAVREP